MAMNQRITIIDRGDDGAIARHRYRIAGTVVASTVPIARLEPGRCAVSDASRPAPPAPPCTAAAAFRHRGIVVDRVREVGCARDGSAARIDIQGIGSYQLDLDSGVLQMPVGDDGLIHDALLGAPLALLLASRGTYLLHAGAVAFDEGAVILLGESGAGKSTLARWLAEAGDRRRLADDILPLSFDAASPRAAPHFPQFKLRDDEQYPSGLPASLPISAVLVLRRGGTTCSAKPLHGHAAALSLVAHTDSSRLFWPELQSAHLEHCARLAERIMVAELQYPNGREALRLVAEQISTIARARE